MNAEKKYIFTLGYTDDEKHKKEIIAPDPIDAWTIFLHWAKHFISGGKGSYLETVKVTVEN